MKNLILQARWAVVLHVLVSIFKLKDTETIHVATNFPAVQEAIGGGGEIDAPFIRSFINLLEL